MGRSAWIIRQCGDGCYVASFKDGERGHMTRNTGGLQRQVKAGKWIRPWSLQKDCSSASTLALPRDTDLGPPERQEKFVLFKATKLMVIC